jgi:uncharacterized protein (TIGR02145 family)
VLKYGNAQQYKSLKDMRDGKVYKTVKIGEQVWMAENLNVSKFRNGDLIPQAKTIEDWVKAGESKKPAWCYYENNPTNGIKYGKLYNWYAVNDPRGLAPKGWIIPSYDSWKILIDFLGGILSAGVKIKSKVGWNLDANGTNESGFSGLPGGNCGVGMGFDHIRSRSSWWTASEVNLYKTIQISIWATGLLIDSYVHKNMGLSVRCIKD